MSTEEKTTTAEPVIAVPRTTITEEQLAAFKKEYKKVYRTVYMDNVYVWHKLGRKTFSGICDETEKIEGDDELIRAREKRICEECILYPEAEALKELVEDDMVTSRIAQEILFKSGFYPPVTSEL